ncbi:leucine-rich repeat receptor protein kinase HPCA1-like [Phragmites australis]|uniref:leucine-rich repeat receptor protein kinase HPCA1-like n=1 Tax=Phragmites australis TaxID=29695 RepID=UPI002D765081|nr:leucine-rich repeat receptor protein kinase HPCA1-like [Phragmites australis]XP_062224559.1 leucine-rich repeat receptor protein kinase HPCA1-like [Phragmites australis]
MQQLLLLFLLLVGLRPSSSQTNSQDVAALQALMKNWRNEPQSWTGSTDPCTSWDGISCSSGRVTEMRLPSMNLHGTLSNTIYQLSALTYLDLSNNPNLGGTLSPDIGNLKQLTILILLGCSFTGNIPKEIGNLTKLTFLALNSNKFTGGIPPTLGLVSNLIWLDLSANQLSGEIPVSPGLNQLLSTKHFHFSENQLTGPMSESLFNANMSLIHVIFDRNKFTGPIPKSLGLVPNLTIIQLDQNQFSGPVPNSIGNLRNLMELNLASNLLNGTVPDLTNATQLNYVDLSNNNFASSPAPGWFSTLTSLNTLFMDNDGLTGTIPSALFSFPQLQQVSLAKNAFNTLNMRGNISSLLRVVNLTNNHIIEENVDPSYNNSLILTGNPVCLDNINLCTLKQKQQVPYATSLGPCGAISCPTDQSANPVTSQNCLCTNPFQGLMIFRAPAFSDMTNAATFQPLESTLAQNLSLAPRSVALSNVEFSPGAPLTLTVKIFPVSGTGFDRSDIIRISSALVNQTYNAPRTFGPYSFIASTYFPSPSGKKSSMSTGAIIGISVACFVLIVALVLVAIYALRQKRIAKEAVEQTTNPFASWGAGGKDNGDVPQLKGARYFSFEELKKCTNNFSGIHEIGSGGYGKVYKGTLANGQIAAIKRAQQGSMQGTAEFKNEIELLSRVHHKNLVSLVGFCYEQGEQMLVYEYIPNGTLRENLMGKGEMHLDWKKRLRIAVGSAKGLAYLHELADPPIIHRDIKSTNILLDESLNAKVADFGLSKLVSDTQKGHVSTQVKGTLGYLDPEYYMTQQLSEKSDVYSFGVVMLELITARQPIEKGRYIVREIRTAIDQYDQEYYGLKALTDPAIRDSAKLVGFRRFVQLALECVEESAVDRPTMNDVVRELEIIIQNEGAQLLQSGSVSAEQFGNAKGRDPYAEHLPMKDESSSSTFDYSSVYSYSAVEPK